MLGNDLPFHQVSALDNFVDSIKDVIDLLAGATLYDGVKLRAETNSGRIVAQYLMDCLEEEPLNKNASKLPEISIVEGKLEVIKENIFRSAGIHRESRIFNNQGKFVDKKNLKIDFKGKERANFLFLN